MELDFVEKTHIKIFRSKVRDEHINLTGNILILSDRLTFLASELASCIRSITDADIIGVITGHDNLDKFEDSNIDYLVIVGFLQNELNYDITDKLRCRNEKLKTVHWAILDSSIHYLCSKHKIYFRFDRMEPVGEFMNYLIEIKECYDGNFIVKHDYKDGPKQLTVSPKPTLFNYCVTGLIRLLKTLTHN